MLTAQDILDSIVEKLIAQATAYQQYTAVGRNTCQIQWNMRLLYNGYCSWPYITTPDQIQGFQSVLETITLPTG